MTALWDAREKLVAAAAVAALHLAIIAALLMTAIDVRIPLLQAHETTLVLLPLQPLAKRPASHAGRKRAGSTAITRDYFYRFTPPLPQADLQGLNLALNKCAPEHWDMLAPEQREACRRIDIALAYDPGAFGFHSQVKAPKHWARALQIKQMPVLVPCASPNFFMLDVKCLIDMAVNGYDLDKMQHYSNKPPQ